MKVLAKANDSTYICEVSHSEVEKFLNKYYGDLGKLSVGDVVNLGQGHDFAGRIEQACKNMAEAMKSFDAARKVMTDYAVVIAKGAEGGA